MKKGLVINCSPVKNGATAEIVKIISEELALRTGPGMPECERIIGSIEHFYGHLEIESAGHLGLASIEYNEQFFSQSY